MRVLIAWLIVLAACGQGERQAPAPAGERIVSLMPSGTEIVDALHATDLLVGVDQYSDFPEPVKKLPKVGNYLTPDLEAIVRLRPTFVIVDDVHGQVAAALHDRGIATVGCSVHGLADVQACLRAVGERLGKARDAEAIVTSITGALATAAAHRPARHPRVLAIIDREPGAIGGLVAAGPGSYLDELLAAVGGDNVLAATGERYPRISLEEVLRARPDVILDLSEAASSGVGAWKDVDVPAVASGKVIALAEPYLRGPSPRVALALDALARAIR
jgi:iron complex transport system substrate-binding protein